MEIDELKKEVKAIYKDRDLDDTEKLDKLEELSDGLDEILTEVTKYVGILTEAIDEEEYYG